MQAKVTGDFVDVVQFGLRLGIEAVDALLQGVFDLIASLADASKGTLGGITTGLDDAVEFAGGNDVKTAAELGDGVENGDV